jgi:hypothetical protein
LPRQHQNFFYSLANSTHVHTLGVQDNPYELSAQLLSSLGIGDGALARLLRNPQNLLRTLELSDMALTDDHMVALVQLLLLPTSHLEEVDISDNEIKADGFMELVRQLPRIQSLKKILIQGNTCTESGLDWDDHNDTLMQSFMENTSLQYMDVFPDIPEPDLLWYYLVLNNAGRRILNTSSQPTIPDGLWPYILA